MRMNIVHFDFLLFKLTLLDQTINKSISLHSIGTSTHRYVIIDFTYCICSTCSWARIFAFILYTSFVSGTVIVKHTFRSTSWIWITLEFWFTFTDTIITFRIRTTRWRITWVRIFWLWNYMIVLVYLHHS